ncbi:MAG: replicative DNA helicase [Clostridia bacterium]|nr:replicative DNA helicase [Clostridia bacterium]
MKVMPNNLEAEQSVIGACLIDEDAIMQSFEVLNKDDFYREDHKIIFGCIGSLIARNDPVDIITLKDELSSVGKLEEIGGIEYIASLPEKVPTTANVGKYINIIKEKAIKRNLINMSNEISKMSFDDMIQTDELTELAEKRIYEITQKKNIKGASKLSDLIIDSINKLEDLYNNGKKKGLSTGFIDIDRRMGGLKGSELIILAARPGMGKSAFALNIATNVAKKEKVPVLIFNLEMGKDQLTDRIICSECMIDAKKYRDGNLDEEEWVRLATNVGDISNANIFIDDNSSITVSEIRSKCRKMQMEEKIGLVIIDYLQLITPSQQSSSRDREVAEISRTLKIIAKELNIPVIALSQLSRANEKRTGKDRRPMISDLRDSGAIEQDADIVMFIHREDYYEETEENKNKAEINIAKFRAGEPGTEELVWQGKYTRFVNIMRNN